MADSSWQQAGLHLRAAFDHVWVLTLPGSSQRAGYMRQSLEEGLRLPRSFLTYFEGASGHEWGTWPRVDFLRRARAAAPASEGQSWWMAPSCAAGQTERCLLPKFRSCATANGSVPRLCNELCYTLSVLAALDDFLRSPHEFALLLEDDVRTPRAERPLLDIPGHLLACAFPSARQKGFGTPPAMRPRDPTIAIRCARRRRC